MRRLNRIQSYMIYETRRLLILIGRDGPLNRIIEVKRDVGCQLNLYEDYAKTYDSEKLKEYLRGLNASLLHDRVYCFFGFVRLHESYYLLAVTNASVIANIHGNDIYSVMGSSIIPVSYMPRRTVEETKYRNLLNSVDLTNCCYFSYTHDLTSSMQMQEKCKCNGENSVQDMFVWNHSAIEPFEYLEKECLTSDAKNSHTWVTYIVHGSIQQKSADFRGARGNHIKLHEDDTHHLRLLTYTLIARRSRHFAGARYLRRGVTEDGFVANEVETEQIITTCMEKITDENKTYQAVGPAPENYRYADPQPASNFIYRSSSLVQLRGSIPLYWHHINLLSPAPDIVMEAMSPRCLPEPFFLNLPSGEQSCSTSQNPVSYPAARIHFKRLYDRYGPHVDILNLVKLHHSKREVTVGMAFVELANSLNGSLRLVYEGVSPKKVHAKGVSDNVEISSSEDEVTDEEGAAPDSVADTAVVTWNDSDRRVWAGKDHSRSPKRRSPKETLLGEEGDSDGQIPTLAQEADYPLTYTVFDLLHYHEEEQSHHAHYQAVVDGENKDVNTATGESESHTKPEALDVFEKLAEITGPFQQRSGFYVQAPSGEAMSIASVSKTASQVSFPLQIEDEREMRLSHSTFLPINSTQGLDDTPVQSNNAMAQCRDGSGSSGPIDNTNESGVWGGDSEGDGEDTWRDVKVEDIGSWVADGRLRSGAGCQINQRGVLRTNCVDCLDRTNIAQFVHAKGGILPQCRALGVCLTEAGLMHMLQMTTDLWTKHGNDLAIQYGGSGAMHSLEFVSTAAKEGNKSISPGSAGGLSSHNTANASVSLSEGLRKGLEKSLSSSNLARVRDKMKDKAKEKGEDIKKFLEGVRGHKAHEEKQVVQDSHLGEEGTPSGRDDVGTGGQLQTKKLLATGTNITPRFKLTGGIKNGIVAVNRYYANVTSDFDKQLSIDLILGSFVPSKDKPPLWEYDLQPQYHRVEASRYQVVKEDSEAEGDGSEGHFDPLKWIGLGTLW